MATLWASVDGALVERMGLSIVRQLGLQSGVAMEVTGRCTEPSDCDRMVEADDPRQAPSANTGRWQPLATPTLRPGTTGRLWMNGSRI